jgi:ABC-type lipoprotein export system ATPase subunit
MMLQLSQVSVRFGPRLLFDTFDVQVRHSQRVVLRGPSGCGKSTLLSLAAGLSDPTTGTVEVCGTTWQPLTRTQRAEFRRQHVAVALQSTVLAEALTVVENLRFASRLRALSTDAELEQAIADVGRQLALTPLLGQPVQTLSGGERQRVAIARCLVSGAGLLLLDEPTSQQDEASARRVSRAISEATESGRTVVLATHDPILLEAAGQVLDLGDIATVGQPPATVGQPPR